MNANYENLVSDKVEKRVAKNLLCDSCHNKSGITNSLPLFFLLYQTLNFHNWRLFCVLMMKDGVLLGNRGKN